MTRAFALVLAFSAMAAAPYLQRGDEVETLYKDYTRRLAHAYETLKSELKRDEPDLYAELNPAPPKPVPYGYQLLPLLTKDATIGERHDPPRAVSTPYSWARTTTFINWQLPKISEMEEQLKAAQTIPVKERRSVYERWLKDYRALESDQRLLDLHVQYNRFWQQAIADDKPHFERLTKLHDLVLEHQAVLDALAARDDAEFVRAIQQAPDAALDRTKTRAELEPELRKLEKQMADVIHAENANIESPPYLKLSHPRPTVWEVRVPVYTDITDKAFLANAKAAIERIWSVEERENTYRMTVDFKVIPPAKLYAGAAVPARGAHLDLRAHAARFPKSGGVLTTGANSTYAIPGNYVALGSQPISQNVLAHEFGHLLGFVDGYFRGFHDLGSGGYEVLEIVPDPADIMCTPGAGHVEAFHYEALFRAREKAVSRTAARHRKT